jgi:Domain of unknown function (DUF4919)
MRRGATAASLMMLLGGVLAGCALSARGPAKPVMNGPTPLANPFSVDFDRLRAEFGARSDFADICERDRPLHRLADLVTEKDWNAILAISEPWLQRCPVDIDAHLIRAVALKELKRFTESDHHLNWFRGLVDSVLTSGDGRTPQTAFVVISVAEEYSILRVLRVRPTRHATLSSGVDELVVEIDGVTGVLYFNPAAHVRRLGERPPAPR